MVAVVGSEQTHSCFQVNHSAGGRAWASAWDWYLFVIQQDYWVGRQKSSSYIGTQTIAIALGKEYSGISL